MAEYNSMILGSGPNGSSPLTKIGKRDQSDPDTYRANIEKVKVYVEDLTVMREQLLKVEFRNIELEELHSKKEREADELRAQVRDLQAHLKVYQNDDRADVALENATSQVKEWQIRLYEER
jgi:DNA repair ATPase RecN